MIVEWVYAELGKFFYFLYEAFGLFVGVIVGVVIMGPLGVVVRVIVISIIISIVVVLTYCTIKVIMVVVGDLVELPLVLTHQEVQLPYQLLIRIIPLDQLPLDPQPFPLNSVQLPLALFPGLIQLQLTLLPHILNHPLVL